MSAHTSVFKGSHTYEKETKWATCGCTKEMEGMVEP